MNESARLTAQVTELQQQLAEADAGDDIRAFERTVKEQSDRNVTLTAQVEALQTARDVSEARETAYRQRVGTAEVALHAAERRADDAEAQVTRLTEKLDRIAPMVCPECGPHVRVDEDGCCATCGADAALAPATPPVYERCVCGHPDDTPTCPIDHDQIQHEQATPPEGPTPTGADKSW